MNSQLERELGENLRRLADGQPFVPDPAAIERRGRRYLRRRTALTQAGLGAGVAAAVALGVTLAVQPAGPGHPRDSGPPRASVPAGHPRASASLPRASAPAASPVVLTQLASRVLAAGNPPGDATLVVRAQAYPDQPTVTVADLYTDKGEYFFARSVSGLPAQIASDNNQGDGVFAREIAAAVEADHGDLAVAREKMAEAPLPGHKPASSGLADNYIWENSQDALIAGSGKPQVRAGVLRILSTLPEVTVTHTTTGGQPTLTLRAAGAAVLPDYQETLVIGATTGIPVKFTGRVPGQAPSVTVTYRVTRVTLAKLEAGQS